METDEVVCNNGEQDQGHLARALEMFELALAGFSSINSQKDRAMCYNNMAIVLRNQGSLVRALELYGQALVIYTAEHGPVHHTSRAFFQSSAKIAI